MSEPPFLCMEPVSGPTQFVRSRSRLRDLGLPEPPIKVAAPQHWQHRGFLISINLNGFVGVSDIGSYLDGSGDLHAGDGRRDCTMYSMYILCMLMIIFLLILALNDLSSKSTNEIKEFLANYFLQYSDMSQESPVFQLSLAKNRKSLSSMQPILHQFFVSLYGSSE